MHRNKSKKRISAVLTKISNSGLLLCVSQLQCANHYTICAQTIFKYKFWYINVISIVSGRTFCQNSISKTQQFQNFKLSRIPVLKTKTCLFTISYQSLSQEFVV